MFPNELFGFFAVVFSVLLVVAVFLQVEYSPPPDDPDRAAVSSPFAPTVDITQILKKSPSSRSPPPNYCCSYHTTECCTNSTFPNCCEGNLVRFCCRSSAVCCSAGSSGSLSDQACCSGGSKCCVSGDGTNAGCCLSSWTCCPSYDTSGCCAAGSTCCIGLSAHFSSRCCTNGTSCCKHDNGTVTCCDSTEYCDDGVCAKKGTGVATGPIIGAVVGAVAAIALCVIVGIIIAFAKKRRYQRLPEERTMYAATPETTPGGQYLPPVLPPPTAFNIQPSEPTPSAPEHPLDPKLHAALQTVTNGIVAALVGIANNRISVDEGVTLMALATTEALVKCQSLSQDEFERAATVIVQFMDALLLKIVPTMAQANREGLVRAVLQRMAALAQQQQKKQRLEDSLDGIRATLVAVMRGLNAGQISFDDAVSLCGIAVAAAMRNTATIGNAEQLRSLVDVFTKWMVIVSDEVAPNISAEAKRQVILKIWEAAASHY